MSVTVTSVETCAALAGERRRNPQAGLPNHAGHTYHNAHRYTRVTTEDGDWCEPRSLSELLDWLKRKGC